MEFVILYVVAMFINLIVIRVGIKRQEFKPGGDKVFAIFCPLLNVAVAAVIIICGICMALYWVANGTFE